MAAKPSKQVKIPDRYKEGEEGPLSSRWQDFFLDRLAETSNVTEAAKFVGANTSRVYKVRREDPAFAARWRAALLEGYEHLEMETLRRLREGTQPDDPKFDIANALRLLVLHRENVAQARAAQRNVSAAEVRASIDRKVEQIRMQVIAEKKKRADN